MTPRFSWAAPKMVRALNLNAMRTHRRLALLLVFALSSCTTIQRTAHMYGNEAPPPLSFQYRDGGSSIYYSFTVGDASQPDTAVFFYGGTGCHSWKSVMPGYVNGLTVSTRVFVLNKRFVPDRSIGLLDCGREFHLANNPNQWVCSGQVISDTSIGCFAAFCFS